MPKYYKILREDLTHHNYKFHEGLNIDPDPWKTGECKPDGFCYSDVNNIFTFIYYGDLICNVEIPIDARTERYGSKSKSNKIIISNIRPLWTVETIQDLINNNADIHVHNDYALCYASENGYTDVVKLLLDHDADIHADNDEALCYAVINNHIDTVKLLLKYGANADNNEALSLASANGHTDIVKLLLDHGANIHAWGDEALRNASANGHTDIIKLLLEHGAKMPEY